MNGPLLIDTCALLWLSGLSGGSAATKVVDALNAARSAGQAALLSPITAWELGMLESKGRLSLTLPIRNWLSALITRSGLGWAGMPTEVLIASHSLPGKVQGDPADRIIIATAREFGMCIITRDRKILDYADKGHVMALAC